jgi:hypothetical protein
LNCKACDKIRNETIRRNLGVPPLQIEIEESRLRWAGHVSKMGGDRIAQKVFEAKAQGGRLMGRPRQTWKEQMSIVMAGRGINWREARIVTQDRSRHCKVEEDD